jgi:AraC-like DNA-binding protein
MLGKGDRTLRFHDSVNAKQTTLRAGRRDQRHLNGASEVFSDLVSGVRRDLASRYLRNKQNSLTEISAMLGFSHLSAFSRWHSAQFGQPPKRSR